MHSKYTKILNQVSYETEIFLTSWLSVNPVNLNFIRQGNELIIKSLGHFKYFITPAHSHVEVAELGLNRHREYHCSSQKLRKLDFDANIWSSFHYSYISAPPCAKSRCGLKYALNDVGSAKNHLSDCQNYGLDSNLDHFGHFIINPYSLALLNCS